MKRLRKNLMQCLYCHINLSLDGDLCPNCEQHTVVSKYVHGFVIGIAFIGAVIGGVYGDLLGTFLGALVAAPIADKALQYLLQPHIKKTRHTMVHPM